MYTNEDTQHDSGSEAVVSPFAQAAAMLPQENSAKKQTKWWIILGAIVVILGSVGAVVLAGRISDPLRTMEKFPVSKYLESHRSVAGAKFRGDLRVEADLGWKDGAGRLMVFTTPEETRPVVVLIPPHLSSIYFTKGQTYVAELEVREGGLIYANTCRKN